MPPEPELSVVIPTYNRLETLRHVIPSLQRNSLAPDLFEIVVADSNSNDGTAEYLAQVAAEDPRVRHLPGPYTGRAMARNAGIAAARGSVVMFTDADIIASRIAARAASGAAPCRKRHRRRRDGAASRFARDLRAAARYPEERRPLASELARGGFPGSTSSPGTPRCAETTSIAVGTLRRRLHRLRPRGSRARLSPGGEPACASSTSPKRSTIIGTRCRYDEQKEKMKLAGRSTVRFYRKHPSLLVQRASRYDLALARGASDHREEPGAARAPRAQRRAAKSGFSRNLVYQYHYVSGIKDALGVPRG